VQQQNFDSGRREMSRRISIWAMWMCVIGMGIGLMCCRGKGGKDAGGTSEVAGGLDGRPGDGLGTETAPGDLPSARDGRPKGLDMSDGGATDDVGTVDGIADGGVTDGGSADGGMLDGGAVDGGISDSGAVDQGTTDVGATDGGTTDGAGMEILDGGAGEDTAHPCGDGNCSEDEDPCSCPEDCLEPMTCCKDEDCPQPLCGPCCESHCVEFECQDVWQPDCCWNNACEPGETYESCPMDCPQESCGNGTCDEEESPESCPTDCSIPCTPEGMPADQEGICCEGSTILNSNWIPDGGDCTGTYCYQPVCANCGDGECGPGENYCSCPDDCSDQDCVQAGGIAMTEFDILDCCDDLTPLTFPEIEGCSLYVCQQCGDGLCAAGETVANCPADCP